MAPKACKSFKVKILTSNSYALKILQTIFAAPAPVKVFRGMGGRGYPSTSRIPSSARSRKSASRTPIQNLLTGSYPQAESPSDSGWTLLGGSTQELAGWPTLHRRKSGLPDASRFSKHGHHGRWYQATSRTRSSAFSGSFTRTGPCRPSA